ncbi:MAG: nicotinate (nicotinamide) nucleotide adenylyltransferase [Spirochaetales bacterium]
MFGGTFDPVHIGHLVMADEVLARLDYERVLFVPTYVPPHKQQSPLASSAQRIAMLELATANRPEFGVLAYEIEQEAVSYTVSTLRHLNESDELTGKPGLMIGEDLVDGFEDWRDVETIVQLADIILLRRPGNGGSQLNRPHCEVDNLSLEISASEIRERANARMPFRYLVLPTVFDYIEERGLYR